MEQGLKDLLTLARGILDNHWTGTYTRPTSSGLYPNQWSWDSGFIAMGNAHGLQDRAGEEIRTLFKAQWNNGLLPHIVFHDPMAPYFLSPNIWQSSRSSHAPREFETSGTVQPPIHATVVKRIYQFAEDQRQGFEFLEEMYPRLEAWHANLYCERDPENEGLVYIRHPWDSGMDDSPLGDTILRRIPSHHEKKGAHLRTDFHQVRLRDRPTHRDYARYLRLLHLFREYPYKEQKIQQHSPFLVQDVFFNTLLCQAEQDVVEIAQILGKDPKLHEVRFKRTAHAVQEKLWDKDHGLYIDYDLVEDEPIEKHTAAGFTPLFAGIPSMEQAERMLTNLNSRAFCPLHRTCFAVPMYYRGSPGFPEHRYWRDLIWININWILYRGLQRYGLFKYATWVIQAIIELPQGYGFYEYFDPEEGAGHGTEDFSWTASLLTDVLLDPVTPDRTRKNDPSSMIHGR